jgi:hypothetical protein
MASVIGRLRTVVFDAADMGAEARFWSALLDIPIVHRSDDWMTLEGRNVRLAVQLAPDHVPPQWPDPSRPQQIHLDIEVDDVDRAEEQVLALGARRLPDPPDADDFRVYADPAGHPFCLVFNT